MLQCPIGPFPLEQPFPAQHWAGSVHASPAAMQHLPEPCVSHCIEQQSWLIEQVCPSRMHMPVLVDEALLVVEAVVLAVVDAVVVDAVVAVVEETVVVAAFVVVALFVTVFVVVAAFVVVTAFVVPFVTTVVVVLVVGPTLVVATLPPALLPVRRGSSESQSCVHAMTRPGNETASVTTTSRRRAFFFMLTNLARLVQARNGRPHRNAQGFPRTSRCERASSTDWQNSRNAP